VERELGGLGDRSEQYERPGRTHHGRGLGRIGHDLGDEEATRLIGQEHQTTEHRQPTATGDQGGMESGAPGLGRVVGIADQEVRGDGGQLPEEEHPEQVVRSDQPDHGPTECGHHAGERGHLHVVAEVGGGVQEDGAPGDGDHIQEQQGIPVDGEDQRQVQGRYPFDDFA
jgi:hypothetical protein